MKKSILYILFLLLIIIADIYGADNSANKEIGIKAATLGAVGIVVTPAMAALNKVVGNQTWPVALKSAAQGAVPFAMTLAGAGAVQTIVTQQIKKVVQDNNWMTNMAIQIPGGMAAGYVGGLAELTLTHSLKKIMAHPEATRLLITGGNGAPAAVIRDMIFFVGMHGNGQLKQKLDELYPQSSYLTSPTATAVSASVSTIVSQPLAVIKTEQQLNCLKQKLTMQDIIKKHGLLKLSTKGLVPRGIAIGLVFGTMAPIQRVIANQVNELSNK